MSHSYTMKIEGKEFLWLFVALSRSSVKLFLN